MPTPIEMLHFCANRENDSRRRCAVIALTQFCVRRDVDPRLQGIVIALFEFTGPAHDWIADFFDLVGSAEGDRQLHMLLAQFATYLEGDSSSYAPYAPAMLCELFRTPEGGRDNDSGSKFNADYLFKQGEALIGRTIAHAAVVRSNADEVACDLGDVLVNVLKVRIATAQAARPDGS
jgi:hypothetical protein